MKLSFQEIKEENQAKDDLIEPAVSHSKAIVRYTPKPQPLKSNACYKHVTLHNQCAKIGIQRTRAKRWRIVGDRYCQPGTFMSSEHSKLMEETYDKARQAFHAAPCTCGTEK